MSIPKIQGRPSLGKSNSQISGAIWYELKHSSGPGKGLESYTRRMPRKGQDSVTSLYPDAAGRAAVKRLRACGTFLRSRVDVVFPGGETWALGRHRCTHRLCPTCGRRRGGKLAEEMAHSLEHLQDAWGFGPNHLRFATFTIPNVRNVAEGLEWLAQTWHRALATKTWGRLVAGGFRCWEVKPGKDGKWNVHLHAILVLWQGRVPYEQLRSIWDKAAGDVHCNMRFDELRGIKAREGRSKGAAVAAYISKYLVKVEDLEGAANAPGGLPHLAAALDGRRLFGAFGAAAVARRWVRTRRPRWMEQVTRAMLGYRDAEGHAPIAAFLDVGDDWENTPSGRPSPTDPRGWVKEDRWRPCDVPAPEAPKGLALELLDTHPGFAPEDRAWTWESTGPKTQGLFDWRKVPKTLEEAQARAATARTLRGMALGCRDPERADTIRRLATAIAPPQAFRWGRWWKATRPERKPTWALRSILPALGPTLTTPHGEPFSEYLGHEVAAAEALGKAKHGQRLAKARQTVRLAEERPKTPQPWIV